KLILVASVKDWTKVRSNWCEVQQLPTDVMLPEYIRARAKNYLDWIGPAIARHTSFEAYSDEEYRPIDHPSKWLITPISNTFFMNALHSETDIEVEEQGEQLVDTELFSQLKKRFTTPYTFANSVTKKSKTSVSEIKRIENLQREEEPETHVMSSGTAAVAKKRPLFLQEKAMSATEIGTVVHTVMQHLPQEGFASTEEILIYLNLLIERKLLTAEEVKVVDPEKVLQFFHTEIGQRFSRAKQLHRELPFTLSIDDIEGDSQIVQGILDCLFEDEDGNWVLLDYKTDKILPSFKEEPDLTNEMKKRYGVQLRIYSEAIESILQVKVDEKVLYLYNAEKEIRLD
ncbi:MAG TPA: PD-(D/E)XK nuclease family protein, partial [Ureibacillus sp.]|nr:PD-(D/E)XK nuclease family protein [Ureibacillus sp.]